LVKGGDTRSLGGNVFYHMSRLAVHLLAHERREHETSLGLIEAEVIVEEVEELLLHEVDL
jgi:hypothetical protein